MTSNSETPSQIPDILTQASKEKFRRQLLIYSRALALGLILAIFYAGYQYSTVDKFHEEHSYCYLCGYYEGKRCSQEYYDPNAYPPKTPQEMVIDIAEYNDREWPPVKYSGGAIGNSMDINLTSLREAVISE